MNTLKRRQLGTVAIPVHRDTLTESEGKSLQQCYRVFASKPITFFAPQGLDMSVYTRPAHDNQVQFAFFPRHYFRNIRSYSRLLMSEEFYRRFEESQFLLIYQLDAYVFRDELDAWCGKGFDYIGAPWLERDSGGTLLPRGVGNGGFSLRRVQAFLDLSKGRFPGFFSTRELIRIHYENALKRGKASQKLAALSRLLVKALGVRNTVGYYARHYTEDDFWCWLVPMAGVPLRIAPFEEARKFSFESCPEYLFQKNQNRLPFGCHAWRRYSPEFWARFIT